MSILTKLHIEDEQLNILKYRLSVIQNENYVGYPSSKPVVQPIEFTYETIKNDPFYTKMLNGKMGDSMKFIITPIQMNSKSTKIEFLDFYVLEHRDNFDGINSNPMTSYVKISFASIVMNDVIMDVKYWKENDPHIKTVEPTKIYNDEDDEPNFIGHHFETMKGEEIEQDEIMVNEEIYLIIETENANGKIVTINLDDEDLDYEYNGEILENDVLKNISLTDDITMIKLKAIQQQK